MILQLVEVARVGPAVDRDSDSAKSFAIPLTFFDLPWLIFQPAKRVFFYRYTELTPELFHSIIVPQLKLSLSIVLRSYLPLSGIITWGPSEPKPSVVVSRNDTVLVTIAEADADFSLLSSYTDRPMSELHALIPELPVSDDSASAFSLQITLFPNHGFCIGYAANHGVLDGNSLSRFFKAWAHICKQHPDNSNSPLPESLIPYYDRSSIKDLSGVVDAEMIEIVRSLQKDKSNRGSLKSMPPRNIGADVVLSTLVLSRENIDKLKERVMKESPCGDRLHLSTFVIAYAYVWTCFVKARGGSGERSVGFLFPVNIRERLDPPLPATYFGNCLFPMGTYNRKAVEFSEEKGFVTAVEILSDLVKGLSSLKIETIAKEFAVGFEDAAKSTQFGSVAGSTRLGVYDSDFGWGRPVKADVLSIGEGAFSMTERRDVSGGVEIGLCLKKTEIDILLSFFHNGLNN